MIQTTTPITIKPVRTITYQSKLLLLGSCFAQNIGKILTDSKFDIVVNPNGITYNPLSIAEILQRLINGKEYTESELEFHNGQWISVMHHGCFNNVDKNITLKNINNTYAIARRQILSASHLIITFGSSVVYERNGITVNNCHKLPSQQFTERQLPITEITDRYNSLLLCLKKLNPDLKIILTVSPVRYLGRGAHAGQVNKSTLIIAADSLCKSHTNVTYFPAFEIMMDELRDYRFYADDMIHPSAIAVQYICERFTETYLTDDTRKLLSEIEKIKRSLSHRPLHPDTPEYLQFKNNLTQKIDTLQKKYPWIKF